MENKLSSVLSENVFLALLHNEGDFLNLVDKDEIEELFVENVFFFVRNPLPFAKIQVLAYQTFYQSFLLFPAADVLNHFLSVIDSLVAKVENFVQNFLDFYPVFSKAFLS